MRRIALCCSLLALLVSPLGCSDDAGGDGDDADAGLDALTDAGADVGGSDAGEDGDDADAGGADADATPVPPPEWCDGATAHRYDPLDDEEMDFFPDGTLVRDDDASPTGIRLDVTSENSPWLDATPPLLRESVGALNDLSGFGTMGGVVLRFTAPVNTLPQTADESVSGDGWQWWDLGVDPPERVPFEARTLEDGLTVVLWPLRPLALASEHAVFVTTSAQADDGGCIAPAATTRELLFGEASTLPNAERIERFAPAYREAMQRVGLEPGDVSVATVYTTHDDLLPIRAAAARVLDEPVAWGDAGDCTERSADGFAVLQCEASTTVLDYRNAELVVDDTVAPRVGAIPVTYWLPADAEGPLPVIVYGHGLNSRRTEGWEIASRIADAGFVVVAMEAVEHGEHPFIDPDEGSEDALRFLGIDLGALEIDARRIRGNFNQTNIDRLRLVQLIRSNGDIDGDGEAELDGTRVAYVGASLGAMCGAGLLALSPDLDAAVLTIGGARLMSIVTDTPMIEEFRPLIDNLVGSAELFDRLVPVAQHLVDAADPGVWAAHILQDRFDDRVPPSVVAAYGMDDDVVPPASGFALARALGAPQLAPVAVPVDLVEVIEQGPVSGNLADGTRTAAFFQYDRVTRGDSVRSARHTDTAKSEESAAQIRAFLTPWAAGELPVVVNPFEVLGTPPLTE